MDSPPQYQQHLDELIAFASSEPRKPDILAAKAEYFRLTGEIFEDDKSFEMRMASFLDFYLFDQVSPKTRQSTPGSGVLRAAVLGRARPNVPRRCAPLPRRSTVSSRCVSWAKASMRLREVSPTRTSTSPSAEADGGPGEGGHPRGALDSLLGGHFLFSACLLLPPPRRGEGDQEGSEAAQEEGAGALNHEMTWEAAKRAVKVDRYRQIAVDKIYDFSEQALARTGVFGNIWARRALDKQHVPPGGTGDETTTHVFPE